MLFWRKALAVFMMMVFLPATVLAAMPLQLCLGADGHRAIELVGVSAHHATDTRHANANNSGATEAEQSDCIDRSVLVVATSVTRSDGNKAESPPSDDEAVAAVVAVQPSIEQANACRDRPLFAALDDVPNSFLIAHATDILLN